MDPVFLKKLPRLYVDAPLGKDATVFLTAEQAHYLKNVMRRRTGDGLRLFNGRDGEWVAQISALDKKGACLLCTKLLHQQGATGPRIHLIFAPIKKNRQDWLIEKATELGVTDFHPVLTQNTEVRALNRARTERQIIEAAEQSERLSVPALHDLDDLFSVLSGWQHTQAILACMEREDTAIPLKEASAMLQNDCAFIIGPEGGFTAGEKEKLRALDAVKPVSLGSTVLRAETAAVFALAAVMFARGK